MGDALFNTLAEAGYTIGYIGECAFAAHKPGIGIVASTQRADGTRTILVNGEDVLCHDKSEGERLDWLVRVELKYR